MTKDPVCGMAIDEKKAATTTTYQGKTYYFCSDSCKTKFLQDPARYAESGHAGHHWRPLVPQDGPMTRERLPFKDPGGLLALVALTSTRTTPSSAASRLRGPARQRPAT